VSDLITIKEAARLMDYKQRTFIAWCRAHHISIFSEQGMRKKYILNEEFLNARNRSLRNKDGISLSEYINSAMNVFSEYTAERESILKEKEHIKHTPQNIKLGKHGVEFLSDLHNNLL
jgi:hypothetical protein